MTLLDISRALRRAWIIVLILLVAGALIGLAAALATPKTYEATSKVYVSTSNAENVSELSVGGDFNQQAVTSFAQVATTPYVLNRVITDLSLKTTAAQLASQVAASSPSSTVVLDITATDGDAALASAIANSTATELRDAVQALLAGSNGQTTVRLTVIQDAMTPTRAIGPNRPLDIIGGAFVGLLAGIVVAIGRELLNTRIRDEADLHAATVLPVLGQVTFDKNAHSSPVLAASQTRGQGNEEYRKLRTALQFVAVDAESSVLAVTSSIASEGKSTTCVNLAATLQAADRSVLLIEADLRRPKVADYLGLEGSVGLSDVLIGAAGIEEVLQVSGSNGFKVLPAGSIPPNPSELLQSKAMADLLDRLRTQYDVVLIDTPPVLPVSDAAIIGNLTGGVILVAASRRVRRGQLVRAIDLLSQLKVGVLGLVLTMSPVQSGAGYDYSQSYGYGGHRPTEPDPGGAAAEGVLSTKNRSWA